MCHQKTIKIFSIHDTTEPNLFYILSVYSLQSSSLIHYIIVVILLNNDETCTRKDRSDHIVDHIQIENSSMIHDISY